jgi:hypothetical protein
MSGDPDAEAARWTVAGTPAGILVHPAKVGIFPDAVEDPKCIDPERAVFENPEFRRSYESVENDTHAWDELHRLVGKGFVTKAPTLAKCVAELGGDVPVISKFGMIVKEKQGKSKRRLILDAKESGVTQCGRKNERIMLPSVITSTPSTCTRRALTTPSWSGWSSTSATRSGLLASAPRNAGSLLANCADHILYIKDWRMAHEAHLWHGAASSPSSCASPWGCSRSGTAERKPMWTTRPWCSGAIRHSAAGRRRW